MNKKIGILLMLLLLIIMFGIYSCVKNIPAYQCEKMIEEKVVESVEEVSGINIYNYEPNCTIVVELKEGKYSYDSVESIFIEVAQIITKRENIINLENMYNEGDDGNIPFLHISFCKKGESRNVIYKFSTQGDYQVWRVNGENIEIDVSQ